MEYIDIEGGVQLFGKVSISPSKNSALPIIASSLLSNKPITLVGVANIKDITSMLNIVSSLGGVVSMNDPIYIAGSVRKSICINCNNIAGTDASYDIVRRMRASILILGPLLTRFGIATVSMPGGCAIGVRPINLHLDAMKKMGAIITLHDGYVEAIAADGKLYGAEIEFPTPSVGATENVMMAAVLADGITTIKNASLEPEVVHLGSFLMSCGAKIFNLGTREITIEGVKELNSTNWHIEADRIEAITYAIATAATGGSVTLENSNLSLFAPVSEAFLSIGIKLSETIDGVHVSVDNRLKPHNIVTAPYPGLPTDVQAQFTSLLCQVDGVSTVSETIFESRFIHIAELIRMGADVTINGHTATIRGVSRLSGASVMASDLRASVSLIIAGLIANGKTTVHRIYHLDRGYESLENKLTMCGAKVIRRKAA